MFPKSQPDLMGYHPDQVDALLTRIKIQFEAAGRSLITSSIVSVARFDLVAGGYQILAVDNTLARLGDSLEAREIAERMLRFWPRRRMSDSRVRNMATRNLRWLSY